jgi:hypothetical protein
MTHELELASHLAEHPPDDGRPDRHRSRWIVLVSISA